MGRSTHISHGDQTFPPVVFCGCLGSQEGQLAFIISLNQDSVGQLIEPEVILHFGMIQMTEHRVSMTKKKNESVVMRMTLLSYQILRKHGGLLRSVR